MLKKSLMTAAAALAITAGATTLSTPDANAGISVSFGFGGGYHGGYYGGYHGGHHVSFCRYEKRLVLRTYWRHGHRYTRLVWRSVRVC